MYIKNIIQIYAFLSSAYLNAFVYFVLETCVIANAVIFFFIDAYYR